MKRQIGSVCFVAGTAIGSGMIALPMVLSSLGILASLALMMAIWALVYYSALVSLELNLQVGKGMTLGALGRYWSGSLAQWAGALSLKTLSYALLSVYIYAGSSIIQTGLRDAFNMESDFTLIAILYSAATGVLLMGPLRWIDSVNRVLFIVLLVVVSVPLVKIVACIDWAHLPWGPNAGWSLGAFRAAIPVMFTSFGFQVIFHTLTDYCSKNAKILRSAFLWGSLIPLIVYALWTCGILGALYSSDAHFYTRMAEGKVDVGALVEHLSHITQWLWIQRLVWCVSLLAIFTSVIGVGVGLVGSWKEMIEKKVRSEGVCSVLSVACTVILPCVLAIAIPKAFLVMLGFAGMILVIIALLLPVYLIFSARISNKRLNYAAVGSRVLLALTVIFGLVIIACEIMNLI